MKSYILILLLFLNLPLFSQVGPTSNWYFGTNAGITFNSGTPVALTNGALTTTEGVATMSDNSGNLLFYTNGVTVWNRNHLVMTNGAGLFGDFSSTQSAIIIQKPLSNNIYYIFTSDNDAGADGIRWSEVDMTLSAGLGAITTNKNLPLLSANQFSCEKLCAVRHCNNKDIWIISKDWNSNVFRCWAIGDIMVGTSPWYQQSWSGVGVVPSGATQGAYGQLKSSPDGRKLAACYYGLAGGINKIEIYDFDPATGWASNAQTISTEAGIYGCEFSPNGKVLYGGCNQGLLLQWNLCAGTLAQIQASRTVISNAGAFVGSLQIGPDSKIYVARNNTSLSVINSPNTLGLGCGYSDLSIPLAGRNSRFGLPNFSSYYNQQTVTVPNPVALSCNLFQFNAPFLNPSCNPVNYSYIWDFGDGTQSNVQNPTHQFPIGSWNVTLTINTGCVPITGNLTVNVVNGVLTGPIYKQ
jgi:hypothetical protein